MKVFRLFEKGPYERPSIILFSFELVRAWWEWLVSFYYRRYHTTEYKGDGHPVLVIPGVFANDFQMEPTRAFISKLGYRAYPWELGYNLADQKVLEILEKKVRFLHEQHQSKVSIVGWSLGGVYARDMVLRCPELINQVITMGSPFRGLTETNNAAWFLRLIRRDKINTIEKTWLDNISSPTGVRAVSIYSKSDGAVPWGYCLESVDDENHVNYEVVSSHVGLPHNLEVLKIIEKELQLYQPLG